MLVSCKLNDNKRSRGGFISGLSPPMGRELCGHKTCCTSNVRDDKWTMPSSLMTVSISAEGSSVRGVRGSKWIQGPPEVREQIPVGQLLRVSSTPPDVFISSGMISCPFLCSFLGYRLLSYLGIKLETMTIGMRDGLVDKGVCSQT